MDKDTVAKVLKAFHGRSSSSSQWDSSAGSMIILGNMDGQVVAWSEVPEHCSTLLPGNVVQVRRSLFYFTSSGTLQELSDTQADRAFWVDILEQEELDRLHDSVTGRS